MVRVRVATEATGRRLMSSLSASMRIRAESDCNARTDIRQVSFWGSIEALLQRIEALLQRIQGSFGMADLQQPHRRFVPQQCVHLKEKGGRGKRQVPWPQVVSRGGSAPPP